ncbi:MAG: T9SS type A sorting domain-containing protein [bacterium]|nr:T9SS type A sorting domain-containing protein [bacterium]
MKGKLLLIAAMLMAFAAVGFGQGFQCDIASFLSEDLEGLADLTDACTEGELFADGVPTGLVIDCATGLEPPAPYFGTQFTTNMGGEFELPGNFYYPAYFGHPTNTFANTFRFEVTGPCVGGVYPVWVSTCFTPAVGPANYFFKGAGEWTCEMRSCGTPCVPTPEVNFTPTVAYGEQDMSACVTLCEGSTTVISVGPVPLPDRIPEVSILPGCEICGDPDCTPANVWNLTEWVLTGTGPYYYVANLSYAAEEGCVCVHLDFIEAVETVDLDVAFDGAVRLNWTEATTANLDKYIISRNGSEIASVAADVYSYVDESFEYGVNYTYELAALDLSGHRTVLATESITPSEGAITVTEYALHQNFPNPFNPTTTIRFDLVKANHVSLKVFNATGQEVATMSGEFPLGVNFHNFDATNLTSGLYFYTIQIGDVYSATKKMLLVK